MNTTFDAAAAPDAPARSPGLARSAVRPAMEALSAVVAAIPSPTLRRRLLQRIFDRDCELVTLALGSRTYTPMTLDDAPIDFEPDGHVGFEVLAGVLANTSLSFGVALMTPRQLAYIFGVARRSGARTAIEIGRYKGGATVVLAAAISPGGTLWSVDDGSLERSLARPAGARTHDDQVRDMCSRLGLDARLIVGDSRTLELDTGSADLVLIDGDHRYEGVASDIERWGKRVRVGGDVLLDDTFPLGTYRMGCDQVGRAVREAIDEGTFELVRAVDRMAHLRRVR
ncbi:MAG: class I SAM-dependent methyltransferase [Dehalococcoidia bacterium]|nr:MAG: class I SAM-dependent methyltransferase [Dehalococcoidia bacterium]